ncbi:MAG TPA: PEP/pyruvate-binding domain-containing protein [Syntrophobacteraceae bacterium]|nr:PEP/pyruvate-binding domain-containing protein [Syntrophobacteraceae bacterium]
MDPTSNPHPPETSASREDGPAAVGRGKRFWKSFLTFLEIIGLRSEDHRIDHELQLARLRLYHTEFRKLLSANNSLLETMGDLERKLISREYIDRAFIKRKVVRILADTHALVESINVISGNRYEALRGAQERISQRLTRAMEEETDSAPGALVMDLQDINGSQGDWVGGKMANFGELANVVGLPTPEGFVATTEAYRLLVEQGGIRSWIQDKHMEIESQEDVTKVSGELRERLMGLEIPAVLQDSIHSAYDRLCAKTGRQVFLAVRSSAVGEDSDFSFAGQFLSLLNIPKDELCQAYHRVVASLYSPEAVSYRLLHGIPGESAQMGVGFVEMVEAVAGGVVFSRDPGRPELDQVLIQAVRGLGAMLVDGKTSPEVLRVPRGKHGTGILRTPSNQDRQLLMVPGKGVREEDLSPSLAREPILTDEEAALLASWAVKLEDHFGCTQDVEWAMGPQRRIFVLQSRPLLLAAQPVRGVEPLPGFPVLLRGGEVGCPGTAAGPAVHMTDDEDLDAFPEGGILVARRSSPRFVRLMTRARAIVTDAGSTTGHMASLARECRIPTLLNTGKAFQTIPRGCLITVDASSGIVYQGEVPDLLKTEADEAWEEEVSSHRQHTPGYRQLKKVVDLVAPLNLTDPSSSTFTADHCQTPHDIARYVHEKSYQEMFQLGDNVGDLRGASFQLDVFLPVDLYIIDLGGGLKSPAKGGKVKPSQVASAPFSAILKGMFHKKIPRFGPRTMDLGGLLSVMMRHATTSPEQDSSFRDPCYALISDNYVNYTARVGYHFSVVDTYCGNTTNKNYITLVFKGGAADYVRRVRRIRAIADILKEYGFSVRITHDMVNARLSKAPREEILQHLEKLGSLLQFFRQMDAAMTSDDSVRVFVKAFLRGDYGLEYVGEEEPIPGQTNGGGNT